MLKVIDTPLLIVGNGPAALIIAKLTSGASLGSLVVGHHSSQNDKIITLNQRSLEILKPHGVLNILLPYFLTSTDHESNGTNPTNAEHPCSIKASVFEQVLKHHCVVNMNITLFDGMTVFDIKTDRHAATATMTDGKSHWQLEADTFVNAYDQPTELNAAIAASATVAKTILEKIKANTLITNG
ncbi:MAG: hypothetical protein KUG79_14415 [Pseudomonadales bacterium]|nr:hypothetical protein [Pseudomonadales bacterium]